MKSATKYLWIVFLLLGFAAQGQTTSEKLKKEQLRLERKIADTKSLLDKTRSNTESSLNELKVIENQISFREQLLRNFDNQIRGAELNVQKKEQQIGDLSERIVKLKEQYKKLLIYAYKHRNQYGRMMFLFSSESYFEAMKRAKYLARISEIQQKQFLAIRQNQTIIREEIEAIEKEKEYKKTMIAEKKKEREAIEADRIKQQAVYAKFKEEEGKLLAQLKEEEANKARLNARIQEAIRKEIAEAEERRRKAEEARKKETAANAAASANANASVAPTPSTNKTTPTFEETKESAVLSASFEGNRGQLPWPVAKGTITENFGTNEHPTLKNVYTNNKGIDISTPKNAQVRAVFDGEVTSVLSIPGAGKVVIVKHGNYRTVYTNLKDTYVSVGSKVTTKKVIGSLLADESTNMSVAHFEIHKVEGSIVTCLNPALWISR
jgi:septal ring factor EnvC (AmiA/AmiB activator)